MSSGQPPSVRDMVVQYAAKLPAGPRVFARLSVLLSSDETDTAQVEELVSLDPALAGHVIKMANSVFYSGEQAISSLNEAIGRMGFLEVHRLVGFAMAEQVYSAGAEAFGMTPEAIWSNSVGGALAVESLARHARVDTHLLYTIGLLRQVGKLALNCLISKEERGLKCPPGVDLFAWEKARFGMTDFEATAEILDSWKMPRDVVDAVRHCLEVTEGPHQANAALLHLASWVVEALSLGVPSEDSCWKLHPSFCVSAGVSEQNVQMAVLETRTELAALKEALS